MSMLPVIAFLSEVPTPATLPAALSTTVDPTPAQLVAPLAFFVAAAIAIAVLAWQLGWLGRSTPWSRPRCPTIADAGRLWIGAGAIVFVAIVVPALLIGGRGGGRGATTQPTPEGDAVTVLLTTSVYVAVGIAALAVHATLGLAPALNALGVRDERPRGRDAWVVLLGAPFAIAITLATASLTQLVRTLLEFHQPSAHAMLLLMQRNERSPWVLVLTIANATLCAPLVEELLFRGHLQTALTSLFPRRWPAILITSAMFALMHERWMWPPIFVLSLVIGYLYERTGNLWVAIATHVAFNATSTTVFLITRGAV